MQTSHRKSAQGAEASRLRAPQAQDTGPAAGAGCAVGGAVAVLALPGSVAPLAGRAAVREVLRAVRDLGVAGVALDFCEHGAEAPPAEASLSSRRGSARPEADGPRGGRVRGTAQTAYLRRAFAQRTSPVCHDQ